VFATDDTETQSTQRNFVLSHQRLYRPRTVDFAVLRLRRVHQDRRAAFLSTPSEHSVDAHEHALPLDLHGVAAYRLDGRLASRPAVAHVELALVQRALDLVTVEKAVAKPGVP